MIAVPQALQFDLGPPSSPQPLDQIPPCSLCRMETTLHRQLKSRYAGDHARTEATLGRYRIDVLVEDELIEIQHGSLAAIRDKVRDLLSAHRVRVVKPIVANKLLVKRRRRGGRVVERRRSPKRGTLLDLFAELVYFTRVFPHPNLTLEAILVDVEEDRHPGHGRRRRWRKGDHVVADQRLIAVHESLELRVAADLLLLAPCVLPTPFDTGHLAAALDVHRSVAQRIAYCYRLMGTARQVGKWGNAVLYEFAKAPKAARKRRVA